LPIEFYKHPWRMNSATEGIITPTEDEFSPRRIKMPTKMNSPTENKKNAHKHM